MTVRTIMTDLIIIITDATITVDIIVMDTTIIMDTVTMVDIITIMDTVTIMEGVIVHGLDTMGIIETQMSIDGIETDIPILITIVMEHVTEDTQQHVHAPDMAVLDTMVEAEARHGQHTEAQLL